MYRIKGTFKISNLKVSLLLSFFLSLSFFFVKGCNNSHPLQFLEGLLEIRYVPGPEAPDQLSDNATPPVLPPPWMRKARWNHLALNSVEAGIWVCPFTV